MDGGSTDGTGVAPAEMAVDSDVGPAPIENVTLWERVHAHLRDEILANRL